MQVTIDLEEEEVTKLKKFCSDNELTVSDTFRLGLQLMKCCDSCNMKRIDNEKVTIEFPSEKVMNSELLKEFLVEDNIYFTPLTR